ncbi:MAG: TRAP transporter large permease [Salinarimonas sp.]
MNAVIVTFGFVAFMILGMPLFAAVGLTAALALFLIDIPLTLLVQTGISSLQPFPLLTIPLFILAGRLMEKGGMAETMIAIAKTLVGSYRGSMALVTIFGCTLFAALSGSSPATTAAIGSVTIPEMKRQGYPLPFAAGVAASAGALGSIIPPSNLLIIYCLVANESIPRIFLAGIIPGLLVALIMAGVAFTICARREYGEVTGEPFTFRPLLRATWQGRWSVMAPVIVLGGIYGGVFTPTEAAAVAVFYALFVGTVIHRKLTIAGVLEALRFTALMAGILIIIAPAYAFGQVLAFYDLPDAVETFLTAVWSQPLFVMLMIGIFLIAVGTFMESLATIVLFAPIFLPSSVSMGVDPLVFGIFLILSCEVGLLTPPMGGNLNIAARLSNLTVERVSVGALPFILPYILGMAIVVLFPATVTYLPDLVYGAR